MAQGTLSSLPMALSECINSRVKLETGTSSDMATMATVERFSTGADAWISIITGQKVRE